MKSGMHAPSPLEAWEGLILAVTFILGALALLGLPLLLLGLTVRRPHPGGASWPRNRPHRPFTVNPS